MWASPVLGRSKYPQPTARAVDCRREERVPGRDRRARHHSAGCNLADVKKGAASWDKCAARAVRPRHTGRVHAVQLAVFPPKHRRLAAATISGSVHQRLEKWLPLGCMNDAAVRGGSAGPYGRPDEGGQRNGHPKHPSAHTHRAAVCGSEDLLSQLGGVASLGRGRLTRSFDLQELLCVCVCVCVCVCACVCV